VSRLRLSGPYSFVAAGHVKSKHDQFVGCRINNEIDEVSIARNDELSHAARQLPPAEFREMRRYFKRAQNCRSHPGRSVGIARKQIIGEFVDISFGRRQIADG
jgi:hypothetical protein